MVGLCESFYVFNVNPSLIWIINKVKGVLSEKVRNRLFLHEDASFLLEMNDEDNLPIEYGGKLEIKTIIEHHKQIVEAQSEKISFLNEIKMNLHMYPKCIRPPAIMTTYGKTIEEMIEEEKKSKNVEFEEVRGSFKVLEID
jgi:hypothetical protein